MNEACRRLNIKYPILQGGMGNVSNPPLTAAVSNAGGLGTFGIGTLSPEKIEKSILDIKKLTDKPFSINVPISVTPHTKTALQMVLKYNVPVVTLSAGNPSPFIPKLHEHGVKVICVVATVKHAKKAEEAGADILVAEGYEAAGINAVEESTTMTLIPQITDAVDIPVMAAGGIGDGRGLVAVFSLGASGVQLGTRLIATKEGKFHINYKQKLIESTDTDTVIIGRKQGRIRRLLKTPYANQIREKEEGMNLEDYLELTNEERHCKGAIEGDFEEGFINAGQVAGLINDEPSVADLFSRMIEEAKQVRGRLNELNFGD